MIVVVESIKTIQGKGDALKSALAQLVPISRKAKGCLQYELHEPIEKKDEFLVLMRWETLDDLHAHEASSEIRDFEKRYDKVLYDEVKVTEWVQVEI